MMARNKKFHKSVFQTI